MTGYSVVMWGIVELPVLVGLVDPNASTMDRTCTGQVVDEDGQPVAGAEVQGYIVQWPREIGDPEVDRRAWIRTQADGQFALDLTTPRPSGPHFTTAVVVRKEGYALSGMRWGPKDKPNARIMIRRPTTIGGTVLDEKGSPMSGAKVSVLLMRFDGDQDRFLNGCVLEPDLTAQTDEQGRFGIDHIDPNTTLELRVEKADRPTIRTFSLKEYTPGQPLQYRAGQKDIRIVIPSPSTIQLLKTIAKTYEANRTKLQTWRGEAVITQSVISGLELGQTHRQGKYRSEFRVDRKANAVRYSWHTPEVVERKGGEEVRSGVAPIDGMTKGDCDYVAFTVPTGPATYKKNLNIYNRDTWVRFLGGSAFDPIYILENQIYSNLGGRLRFFAEEAAAVGGMPNVSRQGNRVTVEMKTDDGNLVERLVLDLSAAGSLLEYYNHWNGNNETHWTMTYEDMNSVFVLKTISLSDNRPKIRMVCDHRALLTNLAVNKPIDPEEFTLHALGLKAGDRIADTRNGLTYTFGETGATESDMPPPLSRSLAGKPLPDLGDLGLNLVDVNDKPLLVCFVDIEQRPSRRCLSELAKKADSLASRSITIVVVQTSKTDLKKYEEWLKTNQITVPIHVVEGDFETRKAAWAVKALPRLILTDKGHIVRAEGFSLQELDEKIE